MPFRDERKSIITDPRPRHRQIPYCEVLDFDAATSGDVHLGLPRPSSLTGGASRMAAAS
jgi:hypothetical protein